MMTKTTEDRLKLQRSFRFAALASMFMLFGGAWFYHVVEKFSWVDAFYFCTITLTTIGYGDLAPTTDIGKIFTIFYVMIGIGIIATFANLLIKNAISRRQIKQESKETHK